MIPVFLHVSRYFFILLRIFLSSSSVDCLVLMLNLQKECVFWMSIYMLKHHVLLCSQFHCIFHLLYTEFQDTYWISWHTFKFSEFNILVYLPGTSFLIDFVTPLNRNPVHGGGWALVVCLSISTFYIRWYQRDSMHHLLAILNFNYLEVIFSLCFLVTTNMQILLNQFSQNLVERWHMGQRRNRLILQASRSQMNWR